MVKVMGFESENQEIQESIRKIGRDLLKEKKVDAIIGYATGTLPMTCAPIIIDNENDVDKLIWDNTCYVNLAKYLAPRVSRLRDTSKGNLKIGIVAKGCVGRALIHLAAEHQIDLDDIVIIGVPCNGIINRQKIEKEVGQKEVKSIVLSGNDLIARGDDFEKKFPLPEYLNELCKSCKIKSPPIVPKMADHCLGDCKEYDSITDEFTDLEEYETKSPEEKWEYIVDALSLCTRCYACREACPMCYCHLCFVDQNKPIWFGKSSDINDIIVFHLIRAIHLAGRCVACGACTGVCPVGIDLSLITRKLEKISKERFNFVSGIDPETLPPMMTFKMTDSEDFMLEED
jgi:formate dehydrogenase subunit beta